MLKDPHLKRQRPKVQNPVDASASVHFPDWRKPLTKLESELLPVRVYSQLTNDPHAGRSSSMSLVANSDLGTFSDQSEHVNETSKGQDQDIPAKDIRPVIPPTNAGETPQLSREPLGPREKLTLHNKAAITRNQTFDEFKQKVDFIREWTSSDKVDTTPEFLATIHVDYGPQISTTPVPPTTAVKDKPQQKKRPKTSVKTAEQETTITPPSPIMDNEVKRVSFDKPVKQQELKKDPPSSHPPVPERKAEAKRLPTTTSNLPTRIDRKSMNNNANKAQTKQEISKKSKAEGLPIIPLPSIPETVKCQPGQPKIDERTGIATARENLSKGPISAAKTLFKNMDPTRDKIGQRTYHEVTSDNICPSMVRGIDFLRDPRLNKGMAFTLEERQSLGIHGLIPPRFKTQEEQVELCKENVERYKDDLDKYIYLVGLQDRNERLFYRLIAENVEKMMPLVYTPTVGLACQKFGLIYRRPRGLFISIHDKGHIYQILRNWPESDVRCIVVTDGERILGLGDLGAYGMGIPVGKLALYTALAGIKPHHCLPIQLDVGTNTQSLLDDPYYIGLRHKRVTGPEYEEFMDEFMQAVVRRYGQNTLIQFEDFGNHNAFALLAKYRDRYCTFNDDIQGTAAVAVAGVLASLRVTKTRLRDQKFLFLGAGEAALGIAMLITQAMVKNDGVTPEEACARIFMADSKGLIVKSRASQLSSQKQIFMKDHREISSFAEMIDEIHPTCILGAAAQKGAFTPAILRKMGEINERPVIFALSNPTSKAECTAAEAYENTDGRAVFASGSPFPTWERNGKTYYPGQGNNSYIFPGVALAVMASGIHHISEDVFLLSAEALANIVTEGDLEQGRLYPPLTQIQNVSVIIAKAIMEDAYAKGYAYAYPEPKDKEAYLKNVLYDYDYDASHHSALPVHWDYPGGFGTAPGLKE